MNKVDFAKSVRIRSFSGLHFPRIWIEYSDLLCKSPYFRMWENADHKNSEYGHFMQWWKQVINPFHAIGLFYTS